MFEYAKLENKKDKKSYVNNKNKSSDMISSYRMINEPNIVQMKKSSHLNNINNKCSIQTQPLEITNTIKYNQQSNRTGIPNDMKKKYEYMSGFSFDDVCVHYNSDKPAQLQALA